MNSEAERERERLYAEYKRKSRETEDDEIANKKALKALDDRAREAHHIKMDFEYRKNIRELENKNHR